MRYLVTGTAGFIGFHLAKLLLERGDEVFGFDSVNDYYNPRLKEARLEILGKYPNYRFERKNLTDAESVGAAFKDFQPDVAVNLAAQAGVRYSLEHPQAYIDSNITGFLNILEACRHFPVKHLVYASSSSVYGNRDNTPFSESDSVDEPISLYAATKKSNELMAHTYAHLFGVPATGLRFFSVYGPWGRPDMAAYIFAKRIWAGETIPVFNEGNLYRDFTYVDDIVSGVVSVLNTPPQPNAKGVRNKVYNIGNHRPEILSRFIEVLEEKLGKKATIEYLPLQPGDVLRTCADITEINRDFGFVPKTPIDVGLGKFAEWFKAEGYKY
ncbi:MAG: NAD-dependent epimerase/dehydratase family protein [Thermoguttaceae bacterium]|nr:NAD-dependent epimerase/dehydratase family protein [Thermoguttaceae bacterium]